MVHRILSAILLALLVVVCYPNAVGGQSIDSLLYLIDNEPVEYDAEKYGLLSQVIEHIEDTESKIVYCYQASLCLKKACEQRDVNLPTYVSTPISEHRLPDDPRFAGMLEQTGLNKYIQEYFS